MRVKPGVFALSEWDDETIKMGLQIKRARPKKAKKVEAPAPAEAPAKEKAAAKAPAKAEVAEAADEAPTPATSTRSDVQIDAAPQSPERADAR